MFLCFVYLYSLVADFLFVGLILVCFFVVCVDFICVPVHLARRRRTRTIY
jgi:hypothetical protein